MRFQWAGVLVAALTPALYGDPPRLTVSPTSMSFQSSFIAPNPASAAFTILNDNHGNMEWTTSTTASNGGNWISVIPASGGLPGLVDGESTSAQVQVNPSGLSAGTYSASITVSASRLYLGVIWPAEPPSRTISVTLVIAAAPAPTLTISTTSVSLQGVSGNTTAASARVSIGVSGQGTLSWLASGKTNTGGNWLTLSPTSGLNAGSIQISAAPGSLAAGTYTGSVTVEAANSPPAAIQVSFTLRAQTPPNLRISTQPLTFSTVTATANPPPQTIAVSNGGEKQLDWRVSSSTFNGGAWLSVSPASGTNDGPITISPSLGTLPPGVYAGTITVTSDGALNSPARVPVNFTVRRQASSVAGGGFYQAANFRSDALVAGGLASIFGIRLGPQVPVGFSASDASSRPPATLGGTRVTVNGIASPLFFVSFNQINLQVPFEVAGRSSAPLVIEAEGYEPATFTIALREADLGVFTVDRTRVAAFNQDGTYNSTDTPAPAGTIVQLFATGQGPLNLAVATGAPAPLNPPFPEPRTAIGVRIGGLPARVVFAGLAPGLVGVTQLNVEVPVVLPANDLTPVEVQMGSRTANPVYLSVGAAQSSGSP